MPRVVVLFINILSSMIASESARILAVIPTPSISHQVVFRPLTQELAKRGHEVIVLTTDPVFPQGKAPANLTEIDVHDISYEYWRKKFIEHATGKKEDLIVQMRTVFEIITYIFDIQTKTNAFKKIIEEKLHFDLLIAEAWARPPLVLSHIFKVPVIQMSSFSRMFPNYETIGAPTHPLLYPSPYLQKLYNLSLLDKLFNLHNEWKFNNMICKFDKIYDEWAQKTYAKDVPSVTDLSNNIDMLFLNLHPVFEGNVPVPKSFLHTWGLNHKSEKALPKDLKIYIDNSKHGVIYMSFGTNTDPANLAPERIQMFIRVFSKLSYNILWKWNQDILPGKTENIKISKWFPQADLLRHPKVKLFITQGGLQSTDEAIVAGVPLIGIPMLADQWYNTEKYVYHGIGMKLDIETITENDLREAIDEVIGNERYRKNIKKLGDLFQDQPTRPLQRAVWWVEHVLRHGGARHLRAPAANISWAQYFEIELVLTLLAVSIIFFIIIWFVLYRLLKMLRTQPKRSHEKKKN